MRQYTAVYSILWQYIADTAGNTPQRCHNRIIYTLTLIILFIYLFILYTLLYI